MAKKAERKTEQTIIDTAVKRLAIAVEADRHNREAAIEDLEFLNGDQWDEKELQRRKRKGRPALQVNLLPKFVDQVVGDMLHTTPSIKIQVADAKSDPNIARIRQGIINDIEYRSNAKGIYGYASKQMVSCGYGAWRVLTRYCDDNPFQQEIYLEGIRNPFLVFMDPTAKDQNYADAKWGFLLEKIPVDEFKERYPKAQPITNITTTTGMGQEHWYDGETVTVAEYFERTTKPEVLVQLEDGRVMEEEDFAELYQKWQESTDKLIQSTVMGTPNQPPAQPEPKIANTRIAEEIEIRQWVINGQEVLSGGVEGNEVPGKYINIVLLKGKELNIEGKNHVYSLIRNAKDSQKMVNYWNTAAAEAIALAPKTPWLATPKQVEGFENDYAAANVENFPVLMYNPDPEAQGPPQRVPTPNPPTAIFEQIRRGEDNIKSIIGMFNADLGAPGSEQTGAAIIARQKPSDIGTFEFSENLARAIQFTGKIINEMIPEVYDSVRDVRIRNIDESETFMPINTTVGSAMDAVKANPQQYGVDLEKLTQQAEEVGEDAEFNDITNGKYDVVVSVGPSYATQRQESTAHLLQLVQAMPQQMAVAADLLVENMDFAGAEELAKRLRMPLVAQGIVPPRKGEQAPEPQGPSPEVQVQMALVEVEKAKVALAEVKAQNEAIKAEVEKMRMQRDMMEFQMRMELAKTDDVRKEAKAQRDYQIDEAKMKAQMLKVMKELQGGKNAPSA